jgi:8-oxo-dGTP pyrophosphatase MutT (NUDIX family)
VVREIAEETGWDVAAGPILDSWMYAIAPGEAGGHVFVVTYGCHANGNVAAPVLSAEHSEVGLFTAAQLTALAMPDGYRRSIATWFARLARQAPGSEASTTA